MYCKGCPIEPLCEVLEGYAQQNATDREDDAIDELADIAHEISEQAVRLERLAESIEDPDRKRQLSNHIGAIMSCSEDTLDLSIIPDKTRQSSLLRMWWDKRRNLKEGKDCIGPRTRRQFIWLGKITSVQCRNTSVLRSLAENSSSL